MGGSFWNDTEFRNKVRKKEGSRGTAFTYDADIRAGKASGPHENLDPKGVDVRESRDSENHPNSHAIATLLDVTGSMGRVVRKIHENLPTLMGLLTRKNYIADPQIMFSAVGDATCDRVPLQVGQFESGTEMADDLSRFFIEGGGGGQLTESYELMAYFLARHTSIDCYEKRRKRGYAFFIGDETPYKKVKANEIRDVLGQGAEADIPTRDIFDELKEKYVTFLILPSRASYGGSHHVIDTWSEYIGAEHVLQLQDEKAVAELIATQIGLCEGTTDVDAAGEDLKEYGSDKALVSLVQNAVSQSYAGGMVSKVTGSSLKPSGGSGAERL